VNPNLAEERIHELLSLLEERVDLDHCRTVDERYRRAFAFAEIDRPPLQIRAPFGKRLPLPAPWDAFTPYPTREALARPAAMLHNQLLSCAAPGVALRDDNPLAIRHNCGTVLIAGLLGATWQLYEDNNPWVESAASTAALERMLDEPPALETHDGVLRQVEETMAFFHDTLAAYSRCRQAVQISLPDTQGPLDTAEQLWGSGIYYAFTESPALLERLLARVTEVTLAVWRRLGERTRDRLAPDAHPQNNYLAPGRALIRNDSSILLSPAMYAEFVRPHDHRLLREAGDGSIHFCGNGQHLIPALLELPELRGLDFGQSYLMDLPAIYLPCRERRVALARAMPPRDDLITGRARKAYPTGVVFFYETTDWDDACEVLRRYRNN